MKSTSIEIIEILKKAGHEAYWAGGCVRDMLLGVEPKDFDIVTSAKPEEIEDLLEHTIPVGKKFGVILAIKNGHNFEIATFRSDSGYSDGRRPDAVIFTTAKEDAFRRDFTINGLFYDPTEDKIMDYINGQEDLKEGLVKFISDPEQRILEDNLRILRAVRFRNALNMQYAPDTYQAIKKHVHLIKNISTERITDELNKMIMGKNAGRAFEELFEIGALEILIPELCKLKGLAQPLQYHTEGDVWDHSIKALNSLTEEEGDPNPLPENPPTVALKWAVFLHDIGKYDTFEIKDDRIKYEGHQEVGADISKKILKRLNFPLKTTNRVEWLVRHHMMVIPILEMPDARRRHWFLLPEFEDLLEVFRADCMGIIPLDLTEYEKIKKLYKHEIAHLKLLPKKLISGEEIMKTLKIPAGERVGEILMDIREKQLDGKLKTKKDASDYLKKLK
ncbi:MAG: CCA tRNA nucleotidyltransferase [Candidatus Peregrinibacteria bacterium]|nr:CCA tRNA nucleotidyltransferase [Candidatus Peregrinibacteria bacterium]